MGVDVDLLGNLAFDTECFVLHYQTIEQFLT